MSGSLLFSEVLDHVREMIDERLARFRADLSRSTGVLPPTQLPGGGNTGGGYSPAAHASSHAAGGSDEVTPAAIGACADDDSRLSDSRAPTAHASSHQHGGSDEVGTATPSANAILKAGSGGTIADGWISLAIARIADLTWSNITGKPSTFAPSAHASSHQHGGGDELATATPGANAIPKAGGGGTIADGWLSSLIARVADIVTHAAVVTGVHGLVNSGAYTLTIPATGTAALRGTAQTFSEDNNFQKIVRLAMTGGGNGYGIRIWDGTTEYGNWQCYNSGTKTYIFFSPNREFDGAWQLLNSRPGGSLQAEDNELVFAAFPASSTSPTERLRINANGVVAVGKAASLTGAGDVDIAGVIAGDKHIRLTEITAPAAPAANQVVIYAEDNGAGKTRLMAKFSSGAAQQIAIQP
jgi:hypothetical protein